MPNYGVLVDIETTGLNPVENVILELGMILFNRDTFEEVDTFSYVVVNDVVIEHLNHLRDTAEWVKSNLPQATQMGIEGAKFVYEMHQANGLDAHIRHLHAQGYRCDLAQIETAAVEWLTGYHISRKQTEAPAVGSSVHFDRKFIDMKMPKLGNEVLHYRNVDISTLKTLVNWWLPAVKKKRTESLNPQGLHRALDDCRDSLGELKFYHEALFNENVVMKDWS